jgi:nucleoside-diphosphate-sugar epimerase
MHGRASEFIKVNANNTIIECEEQILVTGATGFVGTRVLASLLEHGFRRVRCFTRPSSDLRKIKTLVDRYSDSARIEVLRGNLLDRSDCVNATRGVAVIYHLAIGAGGRSFPDAFMNAVVTTRNIVEASLEHACMKRFVNVSSFAVYTNRNNGRGRLLDESCPIETHPELRDAYCYAKVKQDQLVMHYGRKFGLRYVIVRPGVVYGPGKDSITGRVGLATFGIFLHLGGSNTVPFIYVDNCADAIVLAGLKQGVDGEVFNIVDDNLPSSRTFLRLYKRHVRPFRSVYLPPPMSYGMCWLWEGLSSWSEGQLPPFLTRRTWHAYWKGSRYSNGKLKTALGWAPKVSTRDGLSHFFQSCRGEERHA